MAQEAAGEEHTGKSLGSYTPALAGLDKLSVTSILQGPGIATWDIGEYNTPSGDRVKILGKLGAGYLPGRSKDVVTPGLMCPGTLEAAQDTRTSLIQSQFYFEPPFLGLLVLISCQIFTRGSLFFQMSS